MFKTSAIITPALAINYANDLGLEVQISLAHGYVVNGRVLQYDGTGAVVQHDNDLVVLKVSDVVLVTLIDGSAQLP